MLHVTQAFYLKDYQIEVVFNDGKKGIVDLSESLNGKVFEPLKNLGAFKSGALIALLILYYLIYEK